MGKGSGLSVATGIISYRRSRWRWRWSISTRHRATWTWSWVNMFVFPILRASIWRHRAGSRSAIRARGGSGGAGCRGGRHRRGVTRRRGRGACPAGPRRPGQVRPRQHHGPGGPGRAGRDVRRGRVGPQLPVKKPDPGPLLHAASHFGVPAEKSLMLGDWRSGGAAARGVRAAGRRLWRRPAAARGRRRACRWRLWRAGG